MRRIASSISGELTGSGIFDKTFSVSALGIPGVTSVADLDYYVIQFAKEEDGTAGATSIDNVRLTAVPENSTCVLLGVGLAILSFARRRMGKR